MSTNAKVKIDLTTGIIELEGSEAFVTKYLDEFKAKVGQPIPTTPAYKPRLPRKASRSAKTASEQTTPKDRKKSVPKKIEIEEFETNGDTKLHIPSLKAFLDEKKATTSSTKMIVAVGYYVTYLLKQPEFSEGNIEFAYKVLRVSGRPTHLHQTIINKKNTDSWFEDGTESTRWKLSRVGQLYVEETMQDEGD